MKKFSLLLGIFLLFSLFLTGCGNKDTSSAGNQPGRGFKMPDFGQPERQPDIRGLVESVVGNEVTILKIERPQRNEDEVADQANQNNQGNENNNQPANQLSLGGTGNAGGPRGMMGGPGNFRGNAGGQMDAESQAAMLERIKEMSTGKEAVTIPVGIKMLKRGDSSTIDQPEMIEATLSDITQNKMISVWLNQEVTDRKVADFVMVMD